jgi:cytochrome b subunit of formate dehydrogenase
MAVNEEPDSEARQPALVRRFEPIERLGHWWVAFFFVMTALSGLGLGDDRQGGSPALTLHLVSAGALIAGLVLLPVLPGRRALLATAGSLTGLSPRLHKFNVGQTAAAYAIAALLVGIYATGLSALATHADDGGPHGAVIALTFIVLAGHVFLAIAFPPTRPALRGMLTGWVDRTWARRHYPRWVEELNRQPAPSRVTR